jgi:uncharacterized lipoprotein
MMRLLLVSMGLLVVLASGCSGPKTKLDKCHKPQEYQQAEIAPRVRVPDDLEPLDDDLRLAVPFGERRTTPRPPDQPCLVEPPDYMDRSPN